VSSPEPGLLGWTAGRAPEIQLFRDLLTRRIGMTFDRHREAFLESRVRRRMHEAGARSLYEYYRLVTAAGPDGRELQALVDEVAIHETAFFRNPAQFQTLAGVVIPERLAARLLERRRRLHVWSAGCSTGQEVYSAAMTVWENAVLPDTWDTRFVGTDVSAEVLRQAAQGRYLAEQMSGVSPEQVRRYFDGKDGRYTVRAWLRRRVEFRPGNALDGPPGLDLDVVFCRNLMIYLDPAGQRRLVGVIARALAPGGFLFLGHTETLAGVTDAFRMVSRASGIAYQKLA
jgi:chemotaxis protein methyltransferase CheR